LATEGEGEKSEPTTLQPTPEKPDDTPLDNVELPLRIRNVLAAAGLRTVGEVREASDEMLLSLPNLGRRSVAHLRETLGLPSTDGVRPGLKAKGNNDEDSADPCRDHRLFGVFLRSNRGAQGWQADEASETASSDRL
jgi:DNA-directed RNA polymerase alpha subunit